MARPRNDAARDAARHRLLAAGEKTIRARSYASVGIAELLTEADVPRGSFYHYFDGKQAFGLAVAERYHEAQLAFADLCMDPSVPALTGLSRFFEGARADMAARGHGEGCLMCNLSAELADSDPAFQAALDRHFAALSSRIAACLARADLSRIGLAHLSASEAADWLLNGWSGALTRMKATGDDRPLALFLKAIHLDQEPPQ